MTAANPLRLSAKSKRKPKLTRTERELFGIIATQVEAGGVLTATREDGARLVLTCLPQRGGGMSVSGINENCIADSWSAATAAERYIARKNKGDAFKALERLWQAGFRVEFAPKGTGNGK